MAWTATYRPDRVLRCVYCAHEGMFSHFGTFICYDQEYSLYRCPVCGSLIYDPAVVPVRLDGEATPEGRANFRLALRYHLEHGYSAEHIVWCAMAALAGIPPEEQQRLLFVDIGAGIGLSSVFVRHHAGMEVLPIEPSSGDQGAVNLFNLPFHRAMIEELPADVLTELRHRSVVLHLNSVVEHIAHPATVLRSMMNLTGVETISVVVPDGGAIDPAIPFLQQLPCLAPGDHLHLPTVAGLTKLFHRLGLPEVHAEVEGGLIVAAAARHAFSLPAKDELDTARDDFLEFLTHHPDPMVSGGALARMLSYAVMKKDSNRVAALYARFSDSFVPQTLIDHLQNAPDWDSIPFHAGVSAFWLAVNAFQIGHRREGEHWLDVLELFTRRIASDYPTYASTTFLFCNEGRLRRAFEMMEQHRWHEARASLDAIIAMEADRLNGVTAQQLQRAYAMRLEISVLTKPPHLMDRLRIWVRARFFR